MKSILLKIICSLPVILLTLYFIPFLGIVIILFRILLFPRKKESISIWMIITSLLLLLPMLLQYISKMTNYKLEIVDKILSWEYYPKVISYSKFLLIVGVITFLVTMLIKRISGKITRSIRKYMRETEAKDLKIKQHNNLKMEEKREIAKKTHVKKCPYCGADNMLTSENGKCNFCRRNI